ncbi:MAG: hypothetical protein HQL06_12270 [Nitrospirae bacterium]|nr:hypothetical protein [Nitrospirota bacterium]
MTKKIKKKHGGMSAKLYANDAELPHRQKKMSEVIKEYAKPLLYEVETIEQQKQVLEIAIFCWNVSLLSDDERAKAVEKLVNADKSPKHEAVEMFTSMISRKLNEFHDINRKTMAYEITENENGGLSLNVAYSIAS